MNTGELRHAVLRGPDFFESWRERQERRAERRERRERPRDRRPAGERGGK